METITSKRDNITVDTLSSVPPPGPVQEAVSWTVW